jgi:hypothetical protein
MTGNELRLKRRQISFDDVKVGATNPAGNNAKQHVPRLKRWTRHLLDLKKGLSG